MKRSRTFAVGLSSVGSSSCWTLDWIATHFLYFFLSCILWAIKTRKRVNSTKVYIPLISLGLSFSPIFGSSKKQWLTSPPKKHKKIIKIEEKRDASPEISRMSRRTAVSSWVSARGGTTSPPCAAATSTSRPTFPDPRRRMAARCSGPGPPATAARSGRRWPNRRGAVSSWDFLGKTWRKAWDFPIGGKNMELFNMFFAKKKVDV